MEDSNPVSNPDSNPLDVYSQIVSGVAERLTPKVASLRVPRGGQGGGYGRGESLGSGVVFTGDGFLLTNAHVVGKSTGGTAEFSDGTSAPFRVVRLRIARKVDRKDHSTYSGRLLNQGPEGA